MPSNLWNYSYAPVFLLSCKSFLSSLSVLLFLFLFLSPSRISSSIFLFFCLPLLSSFSSSLHHLSRPLCLLVSVHVDPTSSSPSCGWCGFFLLFPLVFWCCSFFFCVRVVSMVWQLRNGVPFAVYLPACPALRLCSSIVGPTIRLFASVSLSGRLSDCPCFSFFFLNLEEESTCLQVFSTHHPDRQGLCLFGSQSDSNRQVVPAPGVGTFHKEGHFQPPPQSVIKFSWSRVNNIHFRLKFFCVVWPTVDYCM